MEGVGCRAKRYISNQVSVRKCITIRSRTRKEAVELQLAAKLKLQLTRLAKKNMFGKYDVFHAGLLLHIHVKKPMMNSEFLEIGAELSSKIEKSFEMKYCARFLKIH